MADIILLDGRGEPSTYSGISVVEFDTVDGGRAQFIGGAPVTKEVDADFSSGNQVITREDGTILEEVIVRKPETLTSENIIAGVTVAGVAGSAATGELVDKMVALDFSAGNQVVERVEGEIINQLTIEKPESLVPENVVAGVNIAGVVGISAGITPEIGFMPTSWDSDGFATDGTWYGENIPKYAFNNESNSAQTWKLVNLLFADELKTIGGHAFDYCQNLALTSLPDSLTSVGNYAFYSCKKLALTSLPDSLTSVGERAFSSCSNLTFTGLPANLTSIGNYAFASCSGLTEITFFGTPSSINVTAFNECSNLKKINVPWLAGDVAGAPWGATNAIIEYDCFATRYAVTLIATGNGEVVGENEAKEGVAYTAKLIPDSGNVVSAVTDNGENVLSRVVDLSVTMPTYTVATADGASYGFELNDNGYYASTNAKQGDSASVSVVTFTLPIAADITIEYINSGEGNYDFGIFGTIDNKLGTDSGVDTNNVYKSCKGESSLNAKTLTYNMPAGEHFIYIKYRKDGSGDKDNDSLQFKIMAALLPGGDPSEYVYSAYIIEDPKEPHTIEVAFAPAT